MFEQTKVFQKIPFFLAHEKNSLQVAIGLSYAYEEYHAQKLSETPSVWPIELPLVARKK